MANLENSNNLQFEKFRKFLIWKNQKKNLQFTISEIIKFPLLTNSSKNQISDILQF